jgi:hypothetical protein
MTDQGGSIGADLTNYGIHISAGQISNLLPKEQELWHSEKMSSV